MKLRAGRLATLAVALGGCGSTVLIGGVPQDAPPTDVAITPDVTVTPDVAITPDATVAPDVTVTPDGTVTPDTPPTVDAPPGRCDGGAPVAETCNGLDDDCDGLIDNGLARACYSGPAGTVGVGMCRSGTEVCVAGAWSVCTGEVPPRGELCDGLDNNCNGVADESLTQRCGDVSWMSGPRYLRTASPRPFVDACAAAGHRTYFAGVDDGSIVEAIPFTFTAWGRPAEAAWISANGAITFGGMIGPYNMTLPVATASLDRAVFAFWDDLLMRTGVCTVATGVAPARAYIVQWNDATTFPMRADVHLTFQLVLDEASGTIDVLYRTMDGAGFALGESATIGIQGGTAPELYDLVSFNRASATPLGGTGFRWTPQATDARGICRAGTQRCSAGAWGTCTGEVRPLMAEVCRNGLDDDCDGMVDDGCM